LGCRRLNRYVCCTSPNHTVLRPFMPVLSSKGAAARPPRQSSVVDRARRSGPVRLEVRLHPLQRMLCVRTCVRLLAFVCGERARGIAPRRFGVRSVACCRLSPAPMRPQCASTIREAHRGEWQGGDAYFGSATTCGVSAGGPGRCSARPCGSATPACPEIVAAPHHSSHGRHAVQRL